MTSQSKYTILSNQDGMALLLTIMTLAILVVVTIQYYKDNWHGLLVSHNYVTRNQLKVVAQSGVNFGIALLEKDMENDAFDTLMDSWAKSTGIDFDGLFDNVNLTVTVTDLSGRLQINSLSGSPTGNNNKKVQQEIKNILLNLLQSESFQIEEERLALEIVDAIVDWVDEDDIESDQGAETSYYQSLQNPYNCRNGLIQSIEELLLIKGVSLDVLHGTAKTPGLADFLTVHGNDSKININTASKELIKAMEAPLSDDLMERLHTYRLDEANKEQLAQVGWYSHIDGWPGDITLNENLTTVKSYFFKIESVATMDDITTKIIIDIKRSENKSIDILGRMME